MKPGLKLLIKCEAICLAPWLATAAIHWYTDGFFAALRFILIFAVVNQILLFFAFPKLFKVVANELKGGRQH